MGKLYGDGGNKKYAGQAKINHGAMTARNQRRLERKGKKRTHMKRLQWEGETLTIPVDNHMKPAQTYLEALNEILDTMKNSPTPPDEGTVIVTPEGVQVVFRNGDWKYEELEEHL